ncbi:ADP-ribosylglycohydrolase family protein [Agarivorans sp.]|uniref:ADP-ribosylglycohydrolase family protein n=1 Tax=Agarivorans sp. TaxID=1872412 RepID=UPI003D03331A
MPDLKKRYQGCLLGLAAGDAVGTSVEFKTRDSFPPVIDMLGGGPFGLQPGQWTDDTSMALCLAHSLLECQGFDAEDQMQRYNRWRTEGYMSSNGRCFDIGVTVSEALSQYLSHGDPFAGPTSPFAAGNGSLMRLAPVVLFYNPNLEQSLHFAGESSRTTHAARECIDACRYFAALLYCALAGMDKQQLLANQYYSANTRKIIALQQLSYLDKDIQQIRGSGYVVDSLEAALWCFAHSNNFKQAILMATNLGDDADTTAAICGQIAGAYYGLDGIPSQWQEKITMAEEILQLAEQLYAHNV